ncbi:LPXTG cell wall anchor domain-containing protein [Shouchella shacheensis]|uniref:LPXTG cell wall anchor domain-containing protein n=1 Tax=Shouchella shacheensis TaxID=1649580 RepID=UPI0007401699|nr:LPXTG cell wall anchor domain-containing protein [Shouchella shacheensis]
MLKKAAPLSFITLFAVAAPAHVSAEEMSASEILQQSNEAMLGLQSYSSQTQMEMTMPDLMDGEPMTMSMHSEEDITLDPFAMHQVVTTSMPEGEDMALESYWTEEGFFQEDPVEGWMKLPGELSQGLDELMGMAMAGDQVAQAEALGEEMSVEDTGDAYLLTYEGDGETLMEAAQEMLNMAMSGDEASMMMEELLAGITFNDVRYEMTIEKDTYYMTELMMDMDMDIEMEGESMNMAQSLHMTVSNFNGVDAITVPEEVLNNATPMDDDMMMEEGGELPDTASNNPLLAFSGAALALTAGGLLWFRRRTAQQS